MVKEQAIICDVCKESVAKSICACCNKDICKRCNTKIEIDINSVKDIQRAEPRKIITTRAHHQFQYIRPTDFNVVRRETVIKDFLVIDLCNSCATKIEKCKRKDIDSKAKKKIMEEIIQALKDTILINQL